jgi:hypothetical protein
MLSLTSHQDSLSLIQTQISNIQLQISKRQDTTSLDLAHFARLLAKTDTVINLSNSQLELNRKQQELTNNSNNLKHKSDESDFYVSVEEIHMMLWDLSAIKKDRLSLWDSSDIYHFIYHLQSVLDKQLNNQFLLSNRYLLMDWLSTKDSIYRYIENDKFMPRKRLPGVNYGSWNVEQNDKKLTDQWINLYFTFIELSQRLDQFMAYYKWGRNDKIHKWKVPNGESYHEIQQFRRLHSPTKL